MNHRPLALSIYAVLMMFVSFSLIFQVAHRTNFEWIGFLDIWRNFNLLTQVILVGCILNAWLALRASRLLFLSAPILVCAVTWNSYLFFRANPESVSASGLLHGSISFNQMIIVSLIFLSAQLLLFVSGAFRAIKMPSLRWWRNSKRYKVALPVQVNVGDGNYELVSVDISSTGLFATISHKRDGVFVTARFSPSDPVELVLRAKSSKPIRLRGEIVRLQQKSVGIYPEGVGIRFEKMNFVERLRLQATLLFYSL